MSRIGNKPLIIPEGTEFKIENGTVIIKGPLGEIKKELKTDILLEVKDNKIFLRPARLDLRVKKLWGTYRTLLANWLEGVVKGFQKKLLIEGVGYRAEKQKENLVLKIGFTHPVIVKPAAGINFEVEKNTIIVKGIDKEKVGNEAWRLRNFKPPDPYKGKGIRYEGEIVKLKPGKRATAAAS